MIDQMIYLEQMYARLLNHVDNHCFTILQCFVVPVSVEIN